jgi:hypothetical protein
MCLVPISLIRGEVLCGTAPPALHAVQPLLLVLRKRRRRKGIERRKKRECRSIFQAVTWTVVLWMMRTTRDVLVGSFQVILMTNIQVVLMSVIQIILISITLVSGIWIILRRRIIQVVLTTGIRVIVAIILRDTFESRIQTILMASSQVTITQGMMTSITQRINIQVILMGSILAIPTCDIQEVQIGSIQFALSIMQTALVDTFHRVLLTIALMEIIRVIQTGTFQITNSGGVFQTIPLTILIDIIPRNIILIGALVPIMLMATRITVATDLTTMRVME